MAGRLAPAFPLLAALFLSALVCADTASAQGHGAQPHWSYSGPDGPEHWGDLDRSFATCKTGKRQAPINIVNAKKAELQPIQFDYKSAPLKILNNGHTIVINYAPGSSITAGGKQYPLIQFHFHKPSEEEIGGKRFAMVMHIVHVRPDGTAAAIGILLKAGKENPFIKTLWANLPKEEGKQVEVPNLTINVADILPANQNYYEYAGSLTTPPCGEGVEFFILKTPVEVSSAQISAFARLYPMNARPIQSTNGREILESDFKK